MRVSPHLMVRGRGEVEAAAEALAWAWGRCPYAATEATWAPPKIMDGDELRELLRRFVSFKALHHHHHLILRAFAEIWKEVFSVYESSAPPPPTLELRPDLGSSDRAPPLQIRPPEEEKTHFEVDLDAVGEGGDARD